MDPIGSLPPQLEAFHRELSDDLHDELGRRRASAGPRAAAASFGLPSLELIEFGVRNALDAFARNLGDGATAFILGNKPLIRAWIGEPTLEWTDRILHGLEDAKAQAGA